MKVFLCTLFFISPVLTSCTVKAVGDPERPITIKAHIILDIKGLTDTAADIEDFVSGKKSGDKLPIYEEEK